MPMPAGEPMSGLVSVLMMAAMMLPSSALMLWRDREAARASGETRLGRRAAIVAAGYFLVWIAISVALVPIGATLADVAPAAAGTIVIAAGAFQLTPWKSRELACLDEQSSRAGAPLRHGVRLGVQCVRSCANLMAILLVMGPMNMRAMALVTAAIMAERIASRRRMGSHSTAQTRYS
jgi:predicted metal-binding membrane protein